MKKYLLFIISAFILVFTLSSCDTSDLENEYHDFHVAYNEEGHYDLCDCGHKEHEEAHIFSDAIHVIQKESCSQEGIYEYHCVGCDYKKEVRKDKLPHEFGDWETTVEATCLNQGQQKRVCKNCGYEEFRDTNKAPHTPVAYDTVDADCTHEGHTGGAYCSVCKEELSAQTTIDKTAHTYGEWTIVDNSTCTSIGSAERECSVCGHKEHKTLDKLSHTVTPYEEDPSTCIHKGHTGGSYCSECGTVLEERTELELANHKYGDWIVTDEPSCTQIGHAKRECEVCGNTEYKELEKLAHTPVAYTDLEANCQHEGHIGGTYCSKCNQELTPYTVLDKTSHSFGDWITTQEPDCIHKGQAKRICSVCNYEEYKELDYTNHKSTSYEDKAASCTEEGHTGGTYCSVCHAELTPYTVIPVTNHNYGAWTTSIEATCTHIGQEVRVCKDCNHEEYREVAIKPHTATPYTDLDASCTHEGHTGGTYCSVCNIELTPYTVIDKTAHTYGDWSTVQYPTCISQGQAKRECISCGHEDYKYLDMIDHTPIPGEAKASTCIEPGHTEGSYCSFCHKELEAPTELPLGSHNYSIETITKNPTLNNEGELTHTCSVCGDSYTTSIDKLPLTQQLWYQSLGNENFVNKSMELYYQDMNLNKEYDILIENKDGKKYVRIYDHATSKVYEYYYDGHEVVESAVEGYRHRKYNELNDPYITYFETIASNAVYFSSFSYDKVERKDGYFLANGIETKNYKGNTETATVGIQIADNLLIEMFAYSSANYFINIQSITDSTTIIIPTATHHHVVDGKCEICNEQYYTYQATKDNMNLSYYVNKNNKSVEFDYDFITNQDDVTFLYPTYTESGNIKRFTILYYEGSSNYYSKQVKSYTINSNKLLKITFKDYSTQRLLLLNDGTAIIASSDSAYAKNPYNGNPVGQTFDLVQADKTIRYYIKSDTEIVITEYKEINYYIIGNKQFINFNSRTIDKVFGYTFMSDNGNGVKPDGSHDYIYFVLNSDFTLEINYTYLNNPAFSVVTFKSIEGYYNQGGKEFYIYFMADNENYVLHYNTTNIEISKI